MQRDSTMQTNNAINAQSQVSLQQQQIASQRLDLQANQQAEQERLRQEQAQQEQLRQAQAQREFAQRQQEQRIREQREAQSQEQNRQHSEQMQQVQQLDEDVFKYNKMLIRLLKNEECIIEAQSSGEFMSSVVNAKDHFGTISSYTPAVRKPGGMFIRGTIKEQEWFSIGEELPPLHYRIFNNPLLQQYYTAVPTQLGIAPNSQICRYVLLKSI